MVRTRTQAQGRSQFARLKRFADSLLRRGQADADPSDDESSDSSSGRQTPSPPPPSRKKTSSKGSPASSGGRAGSGRHDKGSGSRRSKQGPSSSSGDGQAPEMSLAITIPEGFKGKELVIPHPTLEGATITVSVPKGTKPGTVIY